MEHWSVEATWALLNAWGDRYISLNRGNLKQRDWDWVMGKVNAHFVDRRTYKQCKDKMDALKKKYKIEKAKMVDNVGFVSQWAFFDKMEDLVGGVYYCEKKAENTEDIPLLTNGDTSYLSQTSRPSKLTFRKPLEVQPVSYFSQTSGSIILLQPHREVMGADPMMMLPQKQAAPVVDDSYFSPEREPMGAQPAMMPQEQAPPPVVDDSSFRKNYSAVAATTAAVEVDDVEEEEEVVAVIRSLAKAIEKFGERYERVQRETQQQMLELEKRKMQFEKDMEEKRMKFFLDAQVELQKITRARRSGSNGSCS